MAGNYRFNPGSNSLRINPDSLHQNELWIATAGQGVIIYEHPENQLSVSQDPIIAMNNSLEQNYPNPFNPVTNISFSLESDARINLTVFDISGRKLIEVLKDNLYSAGRHTIKFDGSYLPSGVYFYKLSTENFFCNKNVTAEIKFILSKLPFQNLNNFSIVNRNLF